MNRRKCSRPRNPFSTNNVQKKKPEIPEAEVKNAQVYRRSGSWMRDDRGGCFLGLPMVFVLPRVVDYSSFVVSSSWKEIALGSGDET
ncbi:hypothetical protein Cni_G20360 [Canna indica]|uniref:Uncharacterized protein n=1 Tax=Canna indica TaxID=4628 RepID=A0AAQ3QJI2_9LILI|nr:hypothetical protein Cni_G20360 [Canna indica]